LTHKRIDAFPKYPRVEVDTQEDLFSKYLDDSDFFLAIAPESDLELYNITKKAERHSIVNLGSSSKAIKITSEKAERNQTTENRGIQRKNFSGFPDSRQAEKRGIQQRDIPCKK